VLTNCRCHELLNARANEVVALAGEKGAGFWKAYATIYQGCILSLTGNASAAVNTSTPAVTTLRSSGSTYGMPFCLTVLAQAHAELGQYDNAWPCVNEAIAMVETAKEKLWEAEAYRIAGEIAHKSSEPSAMKAEAYFNRALDVARAQQAKSWELRAAMSMARLWRDQGKRDEARDLLAPVYGWFTEGFDTLDLKEAKALLDELAVSHRKVACRTPAGVATRGGSVCIVAISAHEEEGQWFGGATDREV
jgi:hypothetical protein